MTRPAKKMTSDGSSSRFGAAALLAILLGGCFGTPPKEEHFYFLTGPTKLKAKGDGPRVGVADISVAPGYSSERLAYRLGDNHLRYYGYRQWVSEPGRMLTDLTIRHLNASGFFSDVGPSDRVRDPHGILRGHVIAIEEVDEPEDEKWYARLAITFELHTERSERVLLRHVFDTTRPCARRDPADVARLISKILHVELEALSRKVARRLEKVVARRKAKIHKLDVD